MAFCQECGGKLRKDSKYCPNCGVEIEEKIERVHKEHHKQEEKPEPIHYEKPKSSNNAVTAIIVILIIIGIAVAIYISHCEIQSILCEFDCGDSLGSSICKSACAVKYNLCKLS